MTDGTPLNRFTHLADPGHEIADTGGRLALERATLGQKHCSVSDVPDIRDQTAMTTDASLLQRYVTERSEAAFAELVQRHLPLVYFAALRRLHGDDYRARDVAQIVFTQLARQAPSLTTHSSLIGWLFTTTRNTAARLVRDEIRRTAREKEAHAMAPDPNDFAPAADWDRIHPRLDDALAQLKTKDREALLMRFFGGLSSPILPVPKDSVRTQRGCGSIARWSVCAPA